MLHDDGPDGPAVRDHRRDEEVPRAGHDVGQDRIERGLELAYGEDLAAVPGAGHDRVGSRRHRGHLVAADRGEDDHLVFGRAQDDAAGEPETLGEPLEDGGGLADRIRHVIEPGADVDDGLQIGSAMAELALVHRGEDRCRQREQQERHHVEERHALEFDGRSGHDVDGGDEQRGLRVQHDQQQQGVPEGQLETGAVRGEQRDGDEVQVDEEAERALGAAGHVHRPGEEETVEEDHHRDERQPASLRRPSGQFVGHGHRCVDATDGEELDEVDAQDLGPDDGPARHDHGHPKAKEQKGRHPVAEGRVFEALGGMHQTSASLTKRTVVSEAVSGARRSFGSRSSMRPWMIRKNRTASISASGNPKVWAMADAASGLTAVLTPLTTSVTTAPTKACGSNRTAPPAA